MIRRVNVGSRRQAVLFALLAVLLVFTAIRWTSKKDPAPQAPGARRVEEPGEEAPRGKEPGGVKKVDVDDVKVISPEDFDRPRGGSSAGTGRNPFAHVPPTLPPPPTPLPTVPQPHIYPIGPPPPTPTPVPPAITFRFIGTFGPRNAPIAVLVSGDQVVNARQGDVVFGQFIIRQIGYESILVGFPEHPDTRRLGIE